MQTHQAFLEKQIKCWLQVKEMNDNNARLHVFPFSFQMPHATPDAFMRQFSDPRCVAIELANANYQVWKRKHENYGSSRL